MSTARTQTRLCHLPTYRRICKRQRITPAFLARLSHMPSLPTQAEQIVVTLGDLAACIALAFVMPVALNEFFKFIGA